MNRGFFMHNRGRYFVQQGVGADAPEPAPPFSFEAPSFSQTVGTATLFAVVADGAGGYYAGGLFDTVTDGVGSHSRKNICHLDPDGNVTAWNPGSDQQVEALALWGSSYIVVGKRYSSTLADNTLGGFDCRGFGVVDRATGVALSWDPGLTASAGVLGMTVSGDDLFTSQNLASDNVRKWDLNAQTGSTFCTFSSSHWAETIEVDPVTGSVLFAGAFIQVNGAARTKFARVDASGVLESWDTNCNPSIGYIAKTTPGGEIMLCGTNLTSVNGGATVAKGITFVDASTAIATGWVADVTPGSTANAATGAFVTDAYAMAGNGTGARLYDIATGVTVTAFTVTGNVAADGEVWLAPNEERAILFYQATNITPNKLSGSSGMVVISYP